MGIINQGTGFATVLDFAQHSIWLNALIFVAAAACVWFAGGKLSEYADVIAERTGLGRAFVGLLLLATATSLPELATTVTAGVIGNAPLLTGNLLGGVVMQTAILAVMDLLLVRRKPLSYFAPDPGLLLDGVMLVALLALALVGIAVDGAFAFLGMGPLPIVIFGVFVLMLWTTHAPGRELKWKATNPPQPVDDRRQVTGGGALPQSQSGYEGVSSGRVYASFAAGAAVILIAGYLLARTGDALAVQTAIGSTLAGAVLVAIGTSLPEISTTAKAVRLGAPAMAISNIFGSNAFCVALLLVGDVAYREGPLLATASRSDIFLTAMGVLATSAYLWGMLERRDRTFMGMGVASFLVLLLYAVGLGVIWYTG